MAARGRYLVATPPLHSRLHLGGIERETLRLVDPLRLCSGPFLERLGELDRRIYGPVAMAFPRWALYDCAFVPGVVLGLLESDAEAAEEETHLSEEPVTMLVAIPTFEPTHWAVYGLGATVDEGADPPLGALAETLSLFVDLLRPSALTGSAQWSSPELEVFLGLGPLELRAAHLPTHTHPRTLVFRWERDRPKEKEEGSSVDPADEALPVALQRELEEGAQIDLVRAERDAAGRLRLRIRGAGR